MILGYFLHLQLTVENARVAQWLELRAYSGIPLWGANCTDVSGS